MFIELLIGVGLMAAGAATARVFMRRREAEGADDEPDGKKKVEHDTKAEKRKSEKKKPKKAKRNGKKETPSGPRGLKVGDVLLYADTELWLAGMLELDEEGFVARLFPCPGARCAEWVVQLDEVGEDLATLSPTEDVPTGRVPESLPIDGRRLSLETRGHAAVRAEGEHLPRSNDRAAFTILSDAGGRVLIVLDFEKAPRLALVGDRVSKHMVDLLPGGDLEQ